MRTNACANDVVNLLGMSQCQKQQMWSSVKQHKLSISDGEPMNFKASVYILGIISDLAELDENTDTTCMCAG